MSRTLRVALVGGGLGGLTAALALSRSGFETHVFEQATTLREVGAGITISPNAIKVLRALGLEDAVKAQGFESEAIVGRDWSNCQVTFRVPLKGVAQARFGAAHVDLHRADLLDILSTAAGVESRIHFNSRCIHVSSSEHTATVTLQNGRQESFDLVVGCDGIHSLVRSVIHGPDAPRFTGNMCWRCLIPTERLPCGLISPDVSVWTGPGGHIVTYYVRDGRLLNLVAVREVTDWVEESWSVKALTSELVAAFPSVHPSLRMLLECAEHCFKWGLFDRDPLQPWSKQRITLLGDAAHPLLPFLGQGAAMAIEDAYVLARRLAGSPHDVTAALCGYENERGPRTVRVQLAVREQGRIFHMTSSKKLLERTIPNSSNSRGHSGSGQLDTEWLYSYDSTRQL